VEGSCMTLFTQSRADRSRLLLSTLKYMAGMLHKYSTHPRMNVIQL
jgi:hypothetical protein